MMIFRLNRLPPRRVVALLWLAVTLLVVMAATLLGDVTFPALAGITGAQARPAVIVTATLVALPAVLVLVTLVIRFREQKRSLAARESLLTAAQHYAKVGYWEYDVVSGRFVLPDSVHETLGDPGRALQMTVPVLLGMTNPEDREELAAAIGRILGNGTQEQMEYRVTGPNGKERTFWANGTRLLGSDGQPAKIFGIYQDITDRKATEAALRESEDHYRHAVELNPQIPWIEDADGSNLVVSPRWEKLLGKTTKGSDWTTTLHPDDLDATVRTWQAALRDGQPYTVEHRVKLADGSYRWFRAKASARRNDKGEISRWYGTTEDIHDCKSAELALQQSEAFATSILDHSIDCVKVLGLDGRIQYVNQPGLRTMEVDDICGLLGQEWLRLWPEAMQPRVEEALAAAKAGAVARFAGFGPTAKHTPKWWDVCMSPIPGPDGRPVRLLCTSRDITAHKRAQDELERARKLAEAAAQRLRDVLESTTDCVVILDREWRIQFANQQAKNLHSKGDIRIGQSVWDEFPHAVGTVFEERLREAVETQKALTFEEHYQGVDVWVELHAYPSADGLSIFYRDVSARREALQALEQMAHHDSLTGLPNRPHFRDRLEGRLAETTSDSQTAVLFLDLDDFKSVNDALGHPAGDRLLQEAAARLRTCLREGDFAARLGGDEFAILQSGVTHRQEAEGLARRIIARLSEPYLLEGREVVVGASLGIQLASGPEFKADDLLQKADIALYKAKSDGRGVHRFFELGMDQSAQADQELRADLRDALARGEFALHYQPVVRFDTARVVAFEALLRWHHPRRGLIGPGAFMSLAESTGAILEIGSWVLREACLQAASWPQGISVSVNLSPRQFRGGCLVEAVSEALRASRLPAQRLRLEITESLLLQDDETVRRTLDELRALGIRISIDDFGTGYSSLGYLRRFSVDNIKIDQSFVADLAENPRTSAILRAVMTLGEDLGMSITAEGIETASQMERLRALGCREGQGYLFGRPMPADMVDSFIGRDLPTDRAVAGRDLDGPRHLPSGTSLH